MNQNLDVEELLALAKEEMECNKNYDKAQELFKEALLLRPFHIEAMRLMKKCEQEIAKNETNTNNENSREEYSKAFCNKINDNSNETNSNKSIRCDKEQEQPESIDEEYFNFILKAINYNVEVAELLIKRVKTINPDLHMEDLISEIKMRIDSRGSTKSDSPIEATFNKLNINGAKDSVESAECEQEIAKNETNRSDDKEQERPELIDEEYFNFILEHIKYDVQIAESLIKRVKLINPDLDMDDLSSEIKMRIDSRRSTISDSPIQALFNKIKINEAKDSVESAETCVQVKKNNLPSSYRITGSKTLEHKEEAEKCIEIAEENFLASRFAKAERYLKKAENMYPTVRAKDLLRQIADARAKGVKDTEEDMPNGYNKPSTSQQADVRQIQNSEMAIPTGSNEQKVVKSNEYLEAIQRVLQANSDFEILGVERGCTRAEVKKAFRKLSKLIHPDTNKEQGSNEAFMRAAEAESRLLSQCEN